MKPVQDIQKPEEKDWQQVSRNCWRWNGYVIDYWGGKYHCFYQKSVWMPKIKKEPFLPEAQEACWQHYLKTIGANDE